MRGSRVAFVAWGLLLVGAGGASGAGRSPRTELNILTGPESGTYFAVAKDLIPDKIPGIGLLDDALVAELVMRELKHEVTGYRDFCEYRNNEATLRGNKASRADWLESKRRQIFMRIKRRQQERRRHSSLFGSW